MSHCALFTRSLNQPFNLSLSQILALSISGVWPAEVAVFDLVRCAASAIDDFTCECAVCRWFAGGEL